MKHYKYQWDFASATGQGKEGEVVAYDDDTATHINNESPGVLAEVVLEEAKPKKAKTEDDPEAETHAADAPPNDRQVKAPSSKRST